MLQFQARPVQGEANSQILKNTLQLNPRRFDSKEDVANCFGILGTILHY